MQEWWKADKKDGGNSGNKCMSIFGLHLRRERLYDNDL